MVTYVGEGFAFDLVGYEKGRGIRQLLS